MEFRIPIYAHTKLCIYILFSLNSCFFLHLKVKASLSESIVFFQTHINAQHNSCHLNWPSNFPQNFSTSHVNKQEQIHNVKKYLMSRTFSRSHCSGSVCSLETSDSTPSHVILCFTEINPGLQSVMLI